MKTVQLKKICKLFFAAILPCSLLVFSSPATKSNTIYHTRPISALHWHACDHGHSDSDCALLEVPLDYAHPHTGTIKIGISRLKATDKNQRIGTLFVNTGGPGEDGDAGLGMIDGISHLFPKTTGKRISRDFAQIRQHFDIIGFDPRGIGRGDRLDCENVLPYPDLPAIPITNSEWKKQVEYNHRLGLACLHKSGRLLAHIDTHYVVNDIDSIRKALGETTISYFGASYGTEVGQLYAEKYPTHLRATVLDGNVDHTENTWSAMKNVAETTEIALEYYDRLCRTEPACTVPHKTLIKDLDDLMAEAGNGKLITSYGEKIFPANIASSIGNVFFINKSAYAFKVISAIISKNQSALDNLDYLNNPNNTQSSFFSTIPINFERALLCNDFISGIPRFSQYRNWLNQLHTISPHILYPGNVYLEATTECANWPIAAQNPPAPLHINSRLPVFLVANQIDIATPLAESISLHHLIPNSRLLITDAVGHAAYGNSHCGRVAIVRYLLTAQLPWFDEHCSG